MPRRAGRGRQAPRRGYYWDGLQFANTDIGTTTVVFELIGPTAQEFMPGTLVRTRGHLTVINGGSDSTNGPTTVAMKLMYLEVNDAGTITGDHAAIDTHEEDIAMRQLWTHHHRLGQSVAAGPEEGLSIEVDVRAKVKLVASGKWILALLAQANNANRSQLSGYLRSLIMHA